jgi:subtilisin-like proprotein convertase family protein
LHELHQGGSSNDINVILDESDLPALAGLHGNSVQGEWQLFIQDLARFDVGTLNRWALEFTTSGQAQGQIVLEEAPGAHIPDDDVTGIQRDLSTSAIGNVGSVEVSVDITHTYSGDLRISLLSSAGTEVILRERTGGPTDNVVETYTAATTAALENLTGEAVQGTWSLRIADLVGLDVGKLNTWRVVINLAL